MIEMDQSRLAEGSKISRNVIVDFETGRRTPTANNLASIRRTLESAGVMFLDDEGQGPGIRLRKWETPPIALDEMNASNDE